jgi:hypothetical protein
VARFHKALETTLTEKLNRRASVFIDREQRTHGYFATQLRDAARSSRMFLFVVTEWSCRPESWCRREVQTFFDAARPIPGFIGTFDERLVKIVLGRTSGDREPLLMKPVLAKEFGSVNVDIGVWERFPPDDFLREGTPAFSAMQELTINLATFLKSAKGPSAASEVGPPRRTIFLGHVPRELATHLQWLRDDFTRKGHAVLAHTPLPDESEEEFKEYTIRLLKEADISIHLFRELAVAPPGWTAPTDRLQLQYVVEGFRKLGAWAYMWQDPMAPPSSRTYLAQLQEELKWADSADWLDNPYAAKDKKTIQHLSSNVERKLMAPVVQPRNNEQADAALSVLLQCDISGRPDCGQGYRSPGEAECRSPTERRKRPEAPA